MVATPPVSPAFYHAGGGAARPIPASPESSTKPALRYLPRLTPDRSRQRTVEPIDRRQKPRPTGPGWVYVLTCPDFPGCCKIGGTSRTPTHRALELQIKYRTTSAFTVVARHAAADWWIVEQTAHRMLSDCRLPRSELFRCSPAEASQVIEAAATAHARPFAPAVWARRMALPPPPAYPAAPARDGLWPNGRRVPLLRNPLAMVLLLCVLVVLWFAVRQSPWPGVFDPLRAGAAGSGDSVRIIYP